MVNIYLGKAFQRKINFLMVLSFVFLSIQSSFSQSGTVKDIEGNTYQTIQIGTQIWMAENLRTTRYLDGTLIPEIPNAEEWLATKQAALSTYPNTESPNNNVLYNWYAVNSGKLCPQGWHVPSDAEWMELEKAIGLDENLIQTIGARGWTLKIDGKLKTTEKGVWQVDREYYSNETGFSAFPTGYRTNSGTFQFQKQFSYWWSSSSESEEFAWKRHLSYYRDIINRNVMLKNSGLCVRCVTD
ncbi:fibrobacter succinogenes major paralogous domain-containing protein [Aquiflexum sp. TKW24L]|uniref:fibrobacter succinogenes major paralogous domain-containing protein n=1 Tax=Aquiflexum sp. TKW24L TaxID=2942212 RepID=UPI0020BE5F4B|nr:fibrobacter succinogenes major paralogous domain-containing protein [Aquiflexum sp. TKW24L]MCL6261253.1 fibrobacter succinogenes major paralogous domain-containing protein [Aquiflexum sp. TKW24L]